MKVQKARSRRALLRTLLAIFAGAELDPLFRSIPHDRTLMAEAAELSDDAITVDLHCDPNLSSGRRLAEFDIDVPDNMRAGGLDAGVFAVRGDHGTLRRSPTGHYNESRKPATGELFQGSQDQLDKVLKASQAGKIGLATSPTDIVQAKKNRQPCIVKIPHCVAFSGCTHNSKYHPEPTGEGSHSTMQRRGGINVS